MFRPLLRAMFRPLLRHLLRSLLRPPDCPARHPCAFFFQEWDSTTADSVGRAGAPRPTDVYYLVPPSPLPPVSWNHRVGGNFLLRSLNPKDLYQSIPK